MSIYSPAVVDNLIACAQRERGNKVQVEYDPEKLDVTWILKLTSTSGGYSNWDLSIDATYDDERIPVMLEVVIEEALAGIDDRRAFGEMRSIMTETVKEVHARMLPYMTAIAKEELLAQESEYFTYIPDVDLEIEDEDVDL